MAEHRETQVEQPESSASGAAPEARSAIEFDAAPTLSADMDAELIADYVVESLDHIQASEAILLAIEENPDDPEAINTVFRAFHTIKGTSGFLGLDRIQKLAHLAENLLSRARTGEIHIAGHYADLCLASCDTLKTMIEGVRGVEPGGPVPIPDDLHELLARLSSPEADELEPEVAPCEASDCKPQAVVETAAPATEPGECASDEDDGEPQDLGKMLIDQGAVAPAGVTRAAEQQHAGDPRRIGEILVEKEGVPPQAIVQALRAQKKTTGPKAQEGSIRVNTTRLDQLVDMVGELVIAHSMVVQDPDVETNGSAQLVKKVSHTGKITRELQDLTMSMRMIPLKGTFDKMRRVLRDLARKSGKSIRLVTEGDDTEVDRNMVEALGDPLVHMIRNAGDHGIEAPEERRRRGKNDSGTLWLSASHSAGSVNIELRDDGEGLDHERILSKAIENGLVEAGRKLSEDQIADLIFRPGFSTAKVVTDISGRGVGLDVVKRGIESLRGSVKVSSQSGVGTTFSLTLPLTMAITDAMLVAVGHERYLLPTTSIQQSFHPASESLTTVMGRGETVLFRGSPVPIVRLHALFGVEDAVTALQAGLLIVIEAHGARCALFADALLGQHQVVIKSLGDFLGHLPGISGGAILGDGRVGLILDPAGVAQLAQDEQPGDSLQFSGSHAIMNESGDRSALQVQHPS